MVLSIEILVMIKTIKNILKKECILFYSLLIKNGYLHGEAKYNISVKKKLVNTIGNVGGT